MRLVILAMKCFVQAYLLMPVIQETSHWCPTESKAKLDQQEEVPSPGRIIDQSAA
jgi:hypothetical protein